ncbi:MAG: iron-sulfur cluster assembly protein [Pseudomonadota bacterium]
MSAAAATKEQVLGQLGKVIDPCMEAAGLNLSLVDLGIVRSVEVQDDRISIQLGLTEPGCGFTHALVTKVEDSIAELKCRQALDLSFNWQQPWTEEMMTDVGREVFGNARRRGVGMLRRFGTGSALPESG